VRGKGNTRDRIIIIIIILHRRVRMCTRNEARVTNTEQFHLPIHNIILLFGMPRAVLPSRRDNKTYNKPCRVDALRGMGVL